MPIYEFACPDCRRIYSFLSRRLNVARAPACPRCGGKKLVKQLSSFATPRGAKESAAGDAGDEEFTSPDLDDPKFRREMGALEREMGQLDESNPRHIASLIRRMKAMLPPGAVPKEMDTALKRLEAGESPEAIEADMGDVLDQFLGPEPGGEGEGGAKSAPRYTRDSGLYDM